MTPKILVVDDDKFTIKLFEGLFRGKSVEADYALDAAGARRWFRQADYNLVLMDQRLPDGNGLDLVAEMRQSESFARAFDGVGLTGSGTPPHGAGGGMPGATPLTREQAKDPAAYRRARDQAARMGSLVSIVE